MGANHPARRMRRCSDLLFCEATETDAGSWKEDITYASSAKVAGLDMWRLAQSEGLHV